MRFGGEGHKITISLIVFGKQSEMIAFLINTGPPISHTLKSNIGLHANNGFNARFPRFLVKFDSAIHIAVISERYSRHFKSRHFRYELINFNKSVEQGIMGMRMEMHKVFHEISINGYNKFMQKQRWIIGIDEVGRGPLAGPITVAAVAATGNSKFWKNIKNSKKLSPLKREEWNKKIRRRFIYTIASVGPMIIDRIGINKAAKLAVRRVLKKLSGSWNLKAGSCAIMLDGGLHAPKIYPRQETIIKGDERHPLIAAASIVAKVHRDAYMKRLHKKFPPYGFDRHKGYGTAFHRASLKTHGLSSVHRRSFCANINIW